MDAVQLPEARFAAVRQAATWTSVLVAARAIDRVVQAATIDVADASRIYRLGLAAGAAGDWSQGLDLLKRAAPGLRAQGRLGLLAQLLTLCSWDEIHIGRFNDAKADAEEGHRLAIETAQPIWI